MRILVVKLADLGDVLTATPALAALRETWPQAHIAALVSPQGAQVLRDSPRVDQVFTFDKHPLDRWWGTLSPQPLSQALGLFLALRRSGWDYLLLMHHLSTGWGALKYRILCRASGAQQRVGLDNGRGGFLSQRVPDPGFGHYHEVEYCLQVAGAIGARVDACQPMEVFLSQADREYARSILPAQSGRPLVALHPGGGSFGRVRRWPPERFAQVGQGLYWRWGARLVLLGGPQEHPLCAEVARLMGGDSVNLARETTLHQAASILERCHLFLGNDSGLMHLAAAVGTPVLAIFGPSNHQAWGPWFGRGREGRGAVLRVDLPCSPCLYVGKGLGNTKGCSQMECLEKVSVEMVLETAERLLGEVVIHGARGAPPGGTGA